MAGKVIADPTGGVIIGVDMACYAIMVSDEKGEAPEYEDVIQLPNTKSVQVTSSDNSQTESYDNAPKLTAVSKGEKKVNYTKSDFSSENQRDLLGCRIVEGVLVESGDDVPPYIAQGFRAETTKGHRYIWLPKGMMMTPEINAATKDSNLTFQNQMITGTFISRNCDNVMRLQVDKTGAEDTEEFAKQWFSLDTLTKLYNSAEDVEAGTFSINEPVALTLPDSDMHVEAAPVKSKAAAKAEIASLSEV